MCFLSSYLWLSAYQQRLDKKQIERYETWLTSSFDEDGIEALTILHPPSPLLIRVWGHLMKGSATTIYWHHLWPVAIGANCPHADLEEIHRAKYVSGSQSFPRLLQAHRPTSQRVRQPRSFVNSITRGFYGGFITYAWSFKSLANHWSFKSLVIELNL